MLFFLTCRLFPPTCKLAKGLSNLATSNVCKLDSKHCAFKWHQVLREEISINLIMVGFILSAVVVRYKELGPAKFFWNNLHSCAYCRFFWGSFLETDPGPNAIMVIKVELFIHKPSQTEDSCNNHPWVSMQCQFAFVLQGLWMNSSTLIPWQLGLGRFQETTPRVLQLMQDSKNIYILWKYILHLPVIMYTCIIIHFMIIVCTTFLNHVQCTCMNVTIIWCNSDDPW